MNFLIKVIENSNPDMMAIEKVFMGNNIFKEQISLFYEDLFRIGLTYLDNNNMYEFCIYFNNSI